MQRLKYEKFNNSNDVITIDLHNGYTVIAITGFNTENKVYTTTLFLRHCLSNLKSDSILAAISFMLVYPLKS